MKVAIIGASGFIGRNLTKHLLQNSEHSLVLFSRSAQSIEIQPKYKNRVRQTAGDIQNKHDVRKALQNCDVAVYLVHLMDNPVRDFVDAEKSAARNVAAAAKLTGTGKVVYLGSMGEATSSSEKHLHSREATGEILRTKVPVVIQLRTPMIIGEGSAAYELLRNMVMRSPLFVLPQWARTRVQPIAVDDVVRYLAAAIDTPIQEHQTIDIGGPEKLTYAQIAQRYARWKHKRLIVVPTRYIPKRLAVGTMRLFRKNHTAAIAANMMESASATMLVQDDAAAQQFANVHPHKIDSAFS